MSFTIRLLIWFKGKFVGNDSLGNRYYEEKPKSVYDGRQQRRWVIYKSKYDVSNVPPEWHAWLHYRADKPLNGEVFNLPPNQSQLTETNTPGTVDENNKVVKLDIKMKRSYQPWIPNE
jgi:NADH:ubiquinone oxidoreductase subunit